VESGNASPSARCRTVAFCGSVACVLGETYTSWPIVSVYAAQSTKSFVYGLTSERSLSSKVSPFQKSPFGVPAVWGGGPGILG
jgi:hypothetical protein